MKQEDVASPPQKTLEKTITWNERDAYLHNPKFSISFLSVNISAMVPSPQPQHPSPQIHELLSVMVHSPFSQVEEMKEVPPLLAPPLVLSSPGSPPTCDRDPLNHISVFHFHLLGKVSPLAGIEAVISEISPNNFFTLSQPARHIWDQDAKLL